MVFRMGGILGAASGAGHPPQGWTSPPPPAPPVCAAARVQECMRRALLVLACLPGAVLSTAAPALADSKMSISGGVLYFRTEDAGISNGLTVDNDARNRAHFTDEADPYGMSYPSPPCSPGRLNSAGNATEVFCDKGSFQSITIQIGPGEDNVTYKLDDLPATMEGAVGADTLSSAGAKDSLHGGQGDDTLDGGANDDTLSGDEGDDTVKGGDGNDKLDGGAGADTVDAGVGDDQIQAADGVADKIDCGAGTDAVTADGADQLTNCEQVTKRDVAPVAQPTAKDTARPVVLVGGSTSQKLSMRARRVTIAVSASERTLVDVSGYLDAGGINDRLKPATSRIDVGGGGTYVRVTLSKTQVRRVLKDLRRRKRARVILTVSAVDGAGNTSRPRHLTVAFRRR